MPVLEQPKPVRKLAKESSYIPRLENGDQLHAGEFLRRYEAMKEKDKAELIQGVVYMASPVSVDHGEPDGLIQSWLGYYAGMSDGVRHATNTTAKLGPDDIPQPDGMLWKNAGSAQVKDKYLTGAPELVAEVASSSVSLDAGAKRVSYLRSGVQEYLLWRVDDGEIDWWRADSEEGDWVLIEPDDTGLLHSQAFPGLVLNRDAALRLDSKAVLDALKKSVG